MALSKSLVQVARDDLDSIVCRCGKDKLPGRPLCLKCFYQLEPSLRMKMSRAFSEGFAEFYDEAIDFLKQEGRIK